MIYHPYLVDVKSDGKKNKEYFLNSLTLFFDLSPLFMFRAHAREIDLHATAADFLLRPIGLLITGHARSVVH